MKYTYEFYLDGLGGLRIRLPKGISIIPHFSEDILDDEADDYIQILDNIVDQTVPQYEIEGNVTAVYIEHNYTSAINFFMSAPQITNVKLRPLNLENYLYCEEIQW